MDRTNEIFSISLFWPWNSRGGEEKPFCAFLKIYTLFLSRHFKARGKFSDINLAALLAKYIFLSATTSCSFVSGDNNAVNSERAEDLHLFFVSFPLILNLLLNILIWGENFFPVNNNIFVGCCKKGPLKTFVYISYPRFDKDKKWFNCNKSLRPAISDSLSKWADDGRER